MGNLNCKNVNEGKIDLTNIKFYLQNHEDLNINTNNIKRLDKDILKVSNTENITFQNNKNEKKEEDIIVKIIIIVIIQILLLQKK